MVPQNYYNKTECIYMVFSFSLSKSHLYTHRVTNLKHKEMTLKGACSSMEKKKQNFLELNEL